MGWEGYVALGFAVIFLSIALSIKSGIVRGLSLLYSVAFLLFAGGDYVGQYSKPASYMLYLLSLSFFAITFFYNYRFRHLSRKASLKEYIDPLAGTGNRLYFEEVVKAEVESMERLGIRYAVIFIDLDNLKAINDTYGHERGDEYIRLTGKVIKENLRIDDMVARYGGDEFVVICSIRSCGEVLSIVGRLEEGLEGLRRETSMDYSFSLGFACYPDEGRSFEEVLSLADKRMYNNKLKKRNAKTNSPSV